MVMVGFPPFRIDLEDERLWKGQRLLTVRRKPFAILRYLVQNPRRLVTHDELLAHVWNGSVVSESAVRSHLHELRQVLGEGVIETVIGRGYRFTPETFDEARPATPAAVARPEVHAIGRDDQLAVLRAALDRAVQGHRQVCFVTGDPGIGKTTLVDALLEEVDQRDDVIAVRGHCMEQHGTPESYLAVIELLTALRQSAGGDRAVAALVRHAPTFLAQVPHLVPEGQLEDVMRRGGAGFESKIVRELIEAVEAICLQQPLVLVLEDLQWSDVATIDLLSLLGQRRERARLLLIGTTRRAEAQTVTHLLNLVMRNLSTRYGAQTIALDRFTTDDLRRFVERRFEDHALPAGFLDVVERITAGTPLFVVSFLDDLVGRGMVTRRDGRWALTVSLDDLAAHRPESVNQLIDIQLDRLTPAEQRALEAGSVIGSEFATALAAAALETPAEDLDDLYDGLARRFLFLRREASAEWPDGSLQLRYGFTHRLVQEVCLDRTAEARRQRWHRLIAEWLERTYDGRLADIAHLLAFHHERGHAPARAVLHYIVAAETTARRFASRDALRLFRRALELVRRLPECEERDLTELRILVGMAPAALRDSGDSGDGGGDPLAVFDRMVFLARRSGDPERIHAALLNLSVRQLTLARYGRAAEIADEVEALARTSPLPAKLVAHAGSARAIGSFWAGDLARARDMLAMLTATDVPPVDELTFGIFGITDRVTVLVTYLAVTRWLLGDPDGALAEADRALAMARRTGDPYTLGLSCCTLARIRVLRGDPTPMVRDAAELALAAPAAAGWHGQATVLLRWAESRDGGVAPERAEEVVREYHARLAGFPMGTTFVVIPVVDVLRSAGRTAEAATLVTEGIAHVQARGELTFGAELLRLRGELLEPTDRDGAEAAYRQAIVDASAIGARSLVERAERSLAALMQ